MTPTLHRPTRSRAWLAFFAVLVVLAAAGVTLPIVYNLGQQLTAEELATARAGMIVTTITCSRDGRI
jgi:hypothetical protein